MEELIAAISFLANGLKADANTFLWAKSQANFDSELVRNEGSIYRMGGGNFLIALSALSFISLLAKIHTILKTEKCEELFSRYGVYCGDETKAVRDFVVEINVEINIIKDTQNIEKFWRLVRHGLVHSFLPKGNSSISAYSGSDFKGYVKLLNDPSISAITVNNKGGYDCDADQLAVCAYNAGDWMIKYLSDYNDFASKESCFAKLFY